MVDTALNELADVVRRSGLISQGAQGVVLVSGGADSACAAAGMAQLCAPGGLIALHINYALRDDSDADEQMCRALCANLRIDLEVRRPELAEGNVQAAARDVRYAAAEELLARFSGQFIATGHTRSDVAETVLYRLASSPGRRALLGMPARRGNLIRPLLALERDDTRRLAAAATLPFRDESSNADPHYARNRIRLEAMPALRDVNPAAEANIAETRAEIAEEAEVIDRVVSELLEQAGAGRGAVAVRADALAGLQSGLRRLALRELAERAAGTDVPLGRARAAEIWRLVNHPEGGTVELGNGVRALCEYGTVRFVVGVEATPEPAELRVPGICRFGRWEVRAELGAPPAAPGGPEVAALDAGVLGHSLVVRAWRDGDRMRPLGLDGTKTLQDLFSDSKVPRSLRETLPLVTTGERIAWVAGVAVSDEFKLRPETSQAALLSAHLLE